LGRVVAPELRSFVLLAQQSLVLPHIALFAHKSVILEHRVFLTGVQLERFFLVETALSAVDRHEAFDKRQKRGALHFFKNFFF
jgi:hypothetical protein